MLSDTPATTTTWPPTQPTHPHQTIEIYLPVWYAVHQSPYLTTAHNTNPDPIRYKERLSFQV